ncbi:integrase_H2C2 domain-containing protein [Trichonephila inaurata madagascariensis]|uniref:Integrase_H2C2 domain-containing protein n=1 Tax=Trichonephila inaurata madagascariensis TaxID=2747483 RepID=A0A8X6YLY8_9ARAC|nr:integrase_H2C2 domain-containing protein [Trichonephila inaurata madagascariensis]
MRSVIAPTFGPPTLLIGQFITDIQYLKGSENVVAHILSHIHILRINTPSVVDFKKMAKEQQKDSQLQNILAGYYLTSLVLQPFPMGQPPVTFHCNESQLILFVHMYQKFFGRQIFNNMPALSHPGVRSSLKMVAERYAWPSMK